MKYTSVIPILLILASYSLAESNKTENSYYRNENASIEMRLLVEPEDEIPWVNLQDSEGATQRVSKEEAISSSDVEGVSIERDEIVIHFKPTSWSRIRETTTRLKGKRLAIVKDGEIIISPVMRAPIDRAALIDSAPKINLDGFLKGFVLQTRPPHLDSDKIYMQFLSEWIVTHPNDLDRKHHLATLYLEDKESPQIEKALPLFQELAEAKPNDGLIQMRLIVCYIGLGQFDQALATSQHALSNIQRRDQMFMYGLIGEIHYLKGDKENAIENLEIQLERVKESDFPKFEELLGEEQTTKLNEAFGWEAQSKNKMIKKIKSRIEYIRTH